MTDQNDIEQQIQPIIRSLLHYDITFKLDNIFTSPQITNVFMLNNGLFNLLFNYLTITHKKDIILDLIEYIHNTKKEDTNKMLNQYLFYEGLYSLVDIKSLNDTKLINEMLIFNNQPTTDKHFNDIFNSIKHLTLNSYEHNDEIYENARHNQYNFKFLEKYYQNLSLNLSVKNTTDLPNDFIYDSEFGDAFILPYNYNNEIFKKAFYCLCSYDYELSFKNCLKVFLNFEKLFYSKIVSVNSKDSNLITYIYFKHHDGYIPNLRYTIDLPDYSSPDTLQYIKNLENNSCKLKNIGYKTTIEDDEKGIYFKTVGYDYNKIKEHAESLIKEKKYIELLIYLFDSQFLTRSTCLFGYYIYFKYTNKIPKDKKYYDIIAMTEKFDSAFNKISVGFKEYTFNKTTKDLTLQKIINFTHK